MYIAEAHASDEWPINNLPESLSVLNQHKTESDRKIAASVFLETYKDWIHPLLDVKIDTVSNDFNNTYSSWPFRVWIVDDGKIAFKGVPTLDGNDLQYSAVRNYLENHSAVTGDLIVEE